jgi:hypothetical protein
MKILKVPLEKPWPNTKINLDETGCDDMSRIEINRHYWRIFNTVPERR